MADLSNFNTKTLSNDGAWMTAVSPADGLELDIRIKCAGLDSAYFQSAKEKFENKRRKKLENGAGLPSAQELDAARLQTLSECTLAWENVEVDGKPLECNRINAAYVYRNYPWLREQVDAFIGDRRNFLPSSAEGDEKTGEECAVLSSPEAFASDVEKKSGSGALGASA